MRGRGRPPYPDLLTPREQEVLQLLREKYTNRQIAERLGISLPGARYHVSEILAKLQVSTREEAAAWEPGNAAPRQRFGLVGLVTSLLPRLRPVAFGRTAGMALIGLAVLMLGLMALGTYVMEQREVKEPRAQPTQQNPETEGFVAQESPDPEAVIRLGEPVSYIVCSRTTDWQRPDRNAMKPVFTLERVGDGTAPWPLYYAYYLKQFFYIQVPTANSANYENNAFSGFWDNSGVSEANPECDSEALYRQAVSTASDDKASLPFFQSLYVIDHTVTAMHRLGTDLIVVVDEKPRSRETIYFPYPPVYNGFFLSELGFDFLQVVTREGVKLHEAQRVAAGKGQEERQNDATGELAAMILNGTPPLHSSEVAIETSGAVYSLFAGSGKTTVTGFITIADEHGSIAFRASFSGGLDAWQPLATFALSSGSYHITIEADLPANNAWRSFLILRDDQPLP